MKKQRSRGCAIKQCAWMLLMVAMTLGAANAAPPKKRATRMSEEKATKQDVLLIAGLQSTFDIPYDPCMVGGNYEECIRIANKQLVTVQYSKDKKQLIFTPLKKGETTVTIRDESGDIKTILKAVVSESNLVRRVTELKELLRDIEGIELKIVADKIVVDGEVVVVNDLNRLYAVLSDSSYKDIVLNLVTVSPAGMQILAQKIQTEINNPAVKVRVMNGMFVLEGQVEGKGQKIEAENTAKNMLQGIVLPTYALNGPNAPVEVRRAVPGSPILNRLTLAPAKAAEPEKMLRITIDFVEFSKDYLRNFGFAWIPTLEAGGGSVSFGQSTTGGVTTQGNGSISGTIGNLFPKLQTAQNAGYARILEENVLFVKDGTQAELNRKTSIPIQVQTPGPNGTVSTNFQPTLLGPLVKITPKVESDNVSMVIDFDYVSFGGKNGAAIITQNHNFKSEVIVKNEESAAVVNAISNSVSTAFNKDPPGGMPANPLFTLLRSKAFQKNKSQFVVFVTPQVIESTSKSTEDIKARYGFKRKTASAQE